MVSAEPVYDSWGKFWVIFMGVSTAPIRVDLRCRVCKETIQTLTDPQLMKKHL